MDNCGSSHSPVLVSSLCRGYTCSIGHVPLIEGTHQLGSSRPHSTSFPSFSRLFPKLGDKVNHVHVITSRNGRDGKFSVDSAGISHGGGSSVRLTRRESYAIPIRSSTPLPLSLISCSTIEMDLNLETYKYERFLVPIALWCLI